MDLIVLWRRGTDCNNKIFILIGFAVYFQDGRKRIIAAAITVMQAITKIRIP